MIILTGPRKRLEITRSADDWKQFLADPEKHWKEGRSAKMLANAWEEASPGLPWEMQAAFVDTPFAEFEPTLAIPEYEVDLPGGRRPSQNDLFVLGRIGTDLAVIMVEGKVDESFGPLLGDWLVDASPGKLERLAALQDVLGLKGELPASVRYQLLHRTASPVMEAKRLGAHYAAMVVHSFSTQDAWLEDYVAFCRALGVSGRKRRLEAVRRVGEPELWVGWVSGDAGSAVESVKS